MKSFIRPHQRPELSKNSTNAGSAVGETISEPDAAAAAPTSAATEREMGAEKGIKTARLIDDDVTFPLELPTSHFSSKESDSSVTLFAGYGLALVVMMYSNAQWIMEEARFRGEGHSVAKMVVALFAICCYSFVNMGMGLILTGWYIGLIFLPELTHQIVEWVKLFFQKKLQPLDIAKIFVAPVSAEIGCRVWNYVWKNYVCKSYHDKSCTLTALGKYIYNYKNEACFDGLASSSLCEKFVSNLPLIVMTCCMVFLGSVLLPVLNDKLHDFIVNGRMESELRLLDGFATGEQRERESSDSDDYQDAVNINGEQTTEVVETEMSVLEMPTPIPYSEVLNSTSLGLNDAFSISPDGSLTEDSFKNTLRRRPVNKD